MQENMFVQKISLDDLAASSGSHPFPLGEFAQQFVSLEPILL